MTITEIVSRIFLAILAVAIAEVKSKKGKTIGLMTPSELTSIIILLLLAFAV